MKPGSTFMIALVGAALYLALKPVAAKAGLAI